MISILFVAKNSVYKTMTDSSGEPLDCWDEERDAMKWPGGNPVVAHPPCRLWSRWQRHLSTAPESEKECGRFAVKNVREYGGVIEHPACSHLWQDQNLPLPGSGDLFGLSIAVNQWWWGHKARKSTWLYVCGIDRLPEIPFRIGEPVFCCGTHSNHQITEITKTERSATPPAFALWLIETAGRCAVKTV